MTAEQPPYSRRLTDALERADVSVRGLARLLADREGGDVETKRRNIYKWLGEDGIEPDPMRAGLLAVLLSAPELAVLSPRRTAGARLEDRLAALAEADVEIQANQHKALLAQEQMLAELKAIREALETVRSGQRAAPKRKAQ